MAYCQQNPLLWQPQASYSQMLGHQKPVMGVVARMKLNIVSACLSLFLPCVVFIMTASLTSLSIYYDYPLFCWACLLLLLSFIMAAGFLGWLEREDAVIFSDGRNPSWFFFITFSCLLAWVFAAVFGQLNFYFNTLPYNQYVHMELYPSVNPHDDGTQYLDAGRIIFSEGSRLNLTRSASYKSGDIYCVAPIVNDISPGVTTQSVETMSYDYWAAGINCCSPGGDDFACGDYNDKEVLGGGLRVPSSEQDGFFKLAVKQASAAFGTRAMGNPIFLLCTKDPIAKVNSYSDLGVHYYCCMIFAHFTFQLFAVACASVFLAQNHKQMSYDTDNCL